MSYDDLMEEIADDAVALNEKDQGVERLRAELAEVDLGRKLALHQWFSALRCKTCKSEREERLRAWGEEARAKLTDEQLANLLIELEKPIPEDELETPVERELRKRAESAERERDDLRDQLAERDAALERVQTELFVIIETEDFQDQLQENPELLDSFTSLYDTLCPNRAANPERTEETSGG